MRRYHVLAGLRCMYVSVKYVNFIFKLILAKSLATLSAMRLNALTDLVPDIFEITLLFVFFSD